MSSYLGFVIGGYLLGSILFAYVLPKLTRHIDIREMSEDGNPGTYNAFRYGGTVCGICVLLLELLKGFFPVWLCERTVGLQSPWFAAVMAGTSAGTCLFRLSPRARRQGDRGILRGSLRTGAGGNLAAASDAGAVLSAVFTFA